MKRDAKNTRVKKLGKTTPFQPLPDRIHNSDQAPGSEGHEQDLSKDIQDGNPVVSRSGSYGGDSKIEKLY